ncbi:MAG TPA: LppX_LprAFG lipoprotein [Pseudonocardiaceae bacterium]
MMRSVRAVGMTLLAATAVVTAACTGDEGGNGGSGGDLPEAGPLVERAAAATREIETVHFTLAVDGQVPGISISGADGRLTKAGEVQGTAVITVTGQPVESEFVIVGDSLYLKGPTGGFQELPASVAASIYDPTKILDDNLGLAALVAGVADPRVDGREDVDGVGTYRLSVTFAKNNLGVLLPGVGATADLPGRLWVTADEPNRPVKAEVEVPPSGGQQGGTVTITLSEFNAPVEITPPA